MRVLAARNLGLSSRARRRCGLRGAWAARGAFTYVELLVAIGIVAVLAALLIPVVGRMNASARSVRCASNLHQIAIGFQHYAMNNGGRLPEPLAIDLSWERVLRRYLPTTDIFLCPSDNEIAGSLGSSYDWRDTGDAQSTLAGAAITDAKPETVLVYDSLPNWHAPGKMNAARVDGSATTMNARDCLGDVMSPLRGPSTSKSK
jgi:type II secretory pathway pseudopilin PulG